MKEIKEVKEVKEVGADGLGLEFFDKELFIIDDERLFLKELEDTGSLDVNTNELLRVLENLNTWLKQNRAKVRVEIKISFYLCSELRS
jgi:hypothetical protein